MGMDFQAHDYGAAFVNSMATVANMFDNRRRLDLEEKRLASQERTEALQQKGLELQNEQRQRESERDANLQKFMSFPDVDDATPEQLQKMKPVLKYQFLETAGTPDNIEDIPRYRQAGEVLYGGLKQLQGLKFSPNSVLTINRGENLNGYDTTPLFEAHDTLLSKDRFQPHDDTDGTVTGAPGTQYRPYETGGFIIQTGSDGKPVSYTPTFHVEDTADNAQLLNDRDQPIMVPATVNQTNDQNDPVKQLPIQGQLLKLGYTQSLLSQTEKMAGKDPQFALELARKGQLIDSKATRENIDRNILANMGSEGAKEYYHERKAARERQEKAAVSRAVGDGLAKLQARLDDPNDDFTESDFDQQAMQMYLNAGEPLKDAAEAVAKLRGTQYVSMGDGRIYNTRTKEIVGDKKEVAPHTLFSKPVLGGSIPADLLGGARLDPKKYYVGIVKDGKPYFAETKPDDDSFAKSVDKLLTTFVLNNSVGDIREANREANEAGNDIAKSQETLAKAGIVGGEGRTEEDLQRPDVVAAALKGRQAFDRQTAAMEKADLARGTIKGVVGEGQSARTAFTGRDRPTVGAKAPAAKPAPAGPSPQPKGNSIQVKESYNGGALIKDTSGQAYLKHPKGGYLPARLENGRYVVDTGKLR